MVTTMGMINAFDVLQAWVAQHELATYSEPSVGRIFSIHAFVVYFSGARVRCTSVQDSGSWEEEWNNLRHSKLWGADRHSNRWRYSKSIWNKLLRAHHVWRCSVCYRIYRVCFHKVHCGRLGASDCLLISIVIHSTNQKVFVTKDRLKHANLIKYKDVCLNAMCST